MISYKDRVQAANNMLDMDVSFESFIKNLCAASGTYFDDTKSNSGNIENLKERLYDLIMPDKYVQETIEDIDPELQNKIVEICNLLYIQTDNLVDALIEIKEIVSKDRVPDNAVWPKYEDDTLATIGSQIVVSDDDDECEEISEISEIIICDGEITKVKASDGFNSFVLDRQARLKKPIVSDNNSKISIEDLPNTMTKEEVVKLLEQQRKELTECAEILD